MGGLQWDRGVKLPGFEAASYGVNSSATEFEDLNSSDDLRNYEANCTCR